MLFGTSGQVQCRACHQAMLIVAVERDAAVRSAWADDGAQRLTSLGFAAVGLTVLGVLTMGVGGLWLLVPATLGGIIVVLAAPVMVAQRRYGSAAALAGLGMIALAPLVGLLWLVSLWPR